MRKSDVWLFRIGSAAVTFVAVSFGCRYTGRYLHEKEATERAHRERSLDQQKEDARYLARGFSDTEGYRFLESELTAAEMSAAFAKPHPIDENRWKIAGAAALVVAVLGGESARIWAVKRDAQRRISGRYSRP
jgi:hypothetical protein